MSKKQAQPKQPEKPKRKRGRPDGTGFKPTEEQRQLVVVMAGLGVPENDMVAAIINPHTGKPFDPKSLRRIFKKELQQGFVQANTKVGASLFKNATTATDVYPGGIPACQMFWLKCRARWQQNPDRNPLPTPPPSGADADVHDAARRIAFLLALEDHRQKESA